ncbi:DUF3597 domain-containing protein [Sphingomonas cavernae]|uniref:DUF3597 domain-containing protein n=1 Tax=Sphingomonas cavernae TaxID=2320861 RepID=A0A418WJR7_9SPHN|nr:DUF3597 domain-containing protein [Sphingomonas cavernae]RJF90287.1 DUF3597 domain-containing protein [Sphingomonas cavernae]
MSLFGKIKDAIFGKKPAAVPVVPVQSTSAPATQVTPAPAPVSLEISEVDVEVILNGFALKSEEKLNWQTSIVDLLKLLDLDSSLVERKELAKELGYTGALDGSAEMNLWLHKRVMRELGANGGKVPAALLD